eukprot:gnl/TRDRNA2_/TRDRNA2_129417_c0_seq1.p1 gnl/TRDRNA2_/TRDRNA2_129417_c0~~gnl/TRDRNA2_/TRDRNA2_129417_c0_seq1.p1  ORF type:complete len:236 (-),score=53.52 gnl/TRDRNA2_/TRDRNA2_129417_c0_seq1:62-769(-)
MMDRMMSDMMMEPFGPRGGGAGGGRGGPFGGGMMGGGLFGQMEQMMADMEQRGPGGGGGSFQCQTMCFSSSMGADGKVHTQRFSSSTVGDRNRQLVETQQAYANSQTGIDKMSMERHMGPQGRKIVKERSAFSGEERQTEMLRGMEEHEVGRFDQRWQQEASPYLPQHNVRAALQGQHQQLSVDNGRAHVYHNRSAQPSQPALQDTSYGHGGYTQGPYPSQSYSSGAYPRGGRRY